MDVIYTHKQAPPDLDFPNIVPFFYFSHYIELYLELACIFVRYME